MNFCCNPKWFGGIGIGRMSDFCQACGVEAQMTTCHCRSHCGGAPSCGMQPRQDHGCGCYGNARQDMDCGYTTTGCGQSRQDSCGCH